MSPRLLIHQAGPGVTVQDLGRPGYMALGLSRGGAADRLALAEGAALLGQAPSLAALEMAGMGGRFEVTQGTRIALTGAEMRASIDGAAIAWNASHLLLAGAQLVIGPAIQGVYGYLSVGGGVATDPQLGARAAHLVASLGDVLQPGQELPLGVDASRAEAGFALPRDDRFSGGAVRFVPGPQTNLFAQADQERFQSIPFTRDTRGNRMGVRLIPESGGFESEAGLSVLSEIVVPGDIQITGDGTPFVLLAECQTTGGYPRIGSVLPSDLPRVVQAAPGTVLRFRMVGLEEGVAIERRAAEARRTLASRRTRLVRNPHDMRDLLAYQLISGVVSGDPQEEP